MATVAVYPDWYNDDVFPRQDITEVAVVRNYTPTDEDLGSWDASAEKNGSVMAYVSGTKLHLVCDSLTVIPDRMFCKFISLERVTGLASVTSIGAWAFLYTPDLSEADIEPSNLLQIGNDAFRMSGIEDTVDFSKAANAKIGDRAIRSNRWSDAGLTAVRDVEFPRYIYLDVPNADSQLKYKDIPYAQKDGQTVSVAVGGCRTLSAYHAWNCLYAGTSKEYPHFLVWFNAKLNADGKYADNTTISEADRQRDYETLGWNQTAIEYLTSHEQLADIVDRLAYGFPVEMTVRGNTDTGYHTVLIIGCDPETKKLAVVDSGVCEGYGVVYWAAYEDICTEGTEDANETIRKINYNPPVIAAGGTWFAPPSSSGITKTSITEIEIVREYTPTGSETASWDASASGNGKVMAYVNGTKLTIAGNGYRFIWCGSDSSNMFASFTALTRIVGAELLNMRNVTTLQKAFNMCTALQSVDVSKWDVSNCTDMSAMFQVNMNLEELDLSKWDVSKVTNFGNMFMGHQSYSSNGVTMKLTSVGDLSRWNTGSATNMEQMFNFCMCLQSVDVSKWDVSNVTGASGFTRMFAECRALKELDFSGWDTDAVQSVSFLSGSTNLEKITIGENFNFISGVIPTPSADYIPHADGNWYDFEGNAYATIPSNEERTYYASKFLAADDDDNMVFIRNGTLRKLAVAIRHKNGKTDTMYPSVFADEVLTL